MKKTIFGIFVCLLFSFAPAQAQDYPSKPMRFIVPFPPGGLVDTTGRLVAQKLSDKLGQPIVVENRTGASGIIGADFVAKSPPDGYTLLFSTGDIFTTPAEGRNLPFDPTKDVIPITMVARAPVVVVAQAGGPIKSVGDLSALVKKEPGKIAFSSPGTGTINQLAGEWFAIETAGKMVHVPYRGGTPAATGVAAGDVPVGFLSQTSVQGLVDAGKLTVIAVASKQRLSFAPDWPTFIELGLPIEAELWVALFAPARTPPAINKLIAEEVDKIFQEESVRKRFNALGVEVSVISQQDLVKRIQSDSSIYRKVIETSGIKFGP